MIDREKIGHKIAVLRKKSGLSQAALAEKLGVSAQAVSKWESGRNIPDIDIFKELAWILDVTLDSIVNDELEFPRREEKTMLPASVTALALSGEHKKLLESLAPFCSDAELYSLAKEMNDGNLDISLSARIVRRDEKLERTVQMAPECLRESTLRELSPYFAKAFGEMRGNIEPGLRRVADLLRCPDCGTSLSLALETDNTPYFFCENGHRFDVVDGVVDFGSREIRGEYWSLFFKNYNDYLREQNGQPNPRYGMGEISKSEVRWQAIKKHRPRVILDIAGGICSGLKYDLKRINWPCLVIVTDLSHRVLKYNKRYFSEEQVNPYVDIVYLACDCAKLPIQDNAIDVVTSCAGFESMQTKMLDGFAEGYRVLRSGGHAVYDMSVVSDLTSENTQTWIRLLETIPDLYTFIHNVFYDIPLWKQVCAKTGYSETDAIRIYDELPAPDTDRFPFENEILQWMGACLCVSRK